MDAARDIIGSYTVFPRADIKNPYSYPFYDEYETDPSLVDGDLLAPVLLNVRLSLTGYVSLKGVRDQLGEILQSIPPNLTLEGATEEDLGSIVKLYEPLDSGLPDVRGTTLSKVLHRKRSGFVPLYDTHVSRCYQEGENAPIPHVQRNERTWSEFMVLLARAMQRDLTTQASEWQQLTTAVAGPVPLTTLRCLDIVAWTIGGQDS